jgi:hypothetical protein
VLLKREGAIPTQPKRCKAWVQGSVVSASLVPDISEKYTLQRRENETGNNPKVRRKSTVVCAMAHVSDDPEKAHRARRQSCYFEYQ